MGQGANRETKASNRSAVGLGGIVSATKIKLSAPWYWTSFAICSKKLDFMCFLNCDYCVIVIETKHLQYPTLSCSINLEPLVIVHVATTFLSWQSKRKGMSWLSISFSPDCGCMVEILSGIVIPTTQSWKTSLVFNVLLLLRDSVRVLSTKLLVWTWNFKAATSAHGWGCCQFVQQLPAKSSISASLNRIVSSSWFQTPLKNISQKIKIFETFWNHHPGLLWLSCHLKHLHHWPHQHSTFFGILPSHLQVLG